MERLKAHQRRTDPPSRDEAVGGRFLVDQRMERLPGVALESGAIVVGGTAYRAAPLQRAIATEAARAIRARFPRTEVTLGNPPD